MRLEPLSGVRDVIIVFFVFSLIAQDRAIFSIRTQGIEIIAAGIQHPGLRFPPPVAAVDIGVPPCVGVVLLNLGIVPFTSSRGDPAILGFIVIFIPIIIFDNDPIVAQLQVGRASSARSPRLRICLLYTSQRPPD